MWKDKECEANDESENVDIVTPFHVCNGDKEFSDIEEESDNDECECQVDD